MQAMNMASVRQSAPTILCCECGVPIPPNPANTCIDCIRNKVDITEGIPKAASLHFCRDCERYLQPPSGWVKAALESRELLTVCLRKLGRGLGKVRLVDAGFVWTEPHSKRVKVKLTIQKEVFAATILQQVFIVEFTVSNQQCEDCVRIAAKNTWRAVVQVRQKVNHKRTFLFLEQLILKHNAHRDTINIKETKDGLDFFYAQRTHAIRMTDFLQTVTPVKIKTSEKILSSDMHSSTAIFKYNYSVEIVPVCKDDLLCLPPKLVRSLGMIGPLVLCTRISNVIHLIDPVTCKTAELRGQPFWESPMAPLCGSTDLVEYYVIDVQLDARHAGSNGKYLPCTLELAKSTDFGTTYFARCHLGNLVHAGDHVMGYDLSTANLNDDTLASLLQGKGFELPDVVIVKKAYPQLRKANNKRSRAWKLKTLSVDQGELLEKDKDASKRDREFEAFLQDLEEDKDLRSMINLYKSGNAPRKAVEEGEMDTESEAGDDGDFPAITLEELLDDMTLEEGKGEEEGEGMVEEMAD